MKKPVLFIMVALLAVQAHATEQKMKPSFEAVRPVIEACKASLADSPPAEINQTCDAKNIAGYLTPEGKLDVLTSIDVGTCPAFLTAARDYANKKQKLDISKPDSQTILKGTLKYALTQYDNCVTSMMVKPETPERKAVNLWD